MDNMAALLIKEIPADLHRKLKDVASRHRRSMAKEALVLLEEALEGAQPSAHARGRTLPRPFKGRFPLTDEFVNRARREGRM
jgi:hypothetical protein